MHNRSKTDTNFQRKDGKISGRQECGLMTEEEWDQKMYPECSRNYDSAIENIDELSTKVLVLDSQQACAEETAKTEGADYWVYDWDKKICKVKNYQATLRHANAVKQVRGERKCGFLSQKQWTKTLVELCKIGSGRVYDYESKVQPLKVISAASQQACAVESAKTDGVSLYTMWFYDWKTKDCWIADDQQGMKSNSSTKVAGIKECAQMSQEQWDTVMANDCQREPGTTFDYGNNVVISQTVNAEEACANLAAETEGGLFWGFDTKALICKVVNSDDTKHTASDWVTGNRQCGLVSASPEEQTLPKLTSEDVKKLGKHLNKPPTCPASQSNPDNEGQGEEATAAKRPPIIDVFLNPDRKDELKEMLMTSEQKETGAVSKVFFVPSSLGHYFSPDSRVIFRKD